MEDQVVSVLNLYHDPNWHTFGTALPIIAGTIAFLWNNAVGLWKNMTWLIVLLCRIFKVIHYRVVKYFEKSALEEVIIYAVKGVRLYDYYVDRLRFSGSDLEVQFPTIDNDYRFIIFFKGNDITYGLTRSELKRIKKFVCPIRNHDRVIMAAEIKEKDMRKNREWRDNMTVALWNKTQRGADGLKIDCDGCMW